MIPKALEACQVCRHAQIFHQPSKWEQKKCFVSLICTGPLPKSGGVWYISMHSKQQIFSSPVGRWNRIPSKPTIRLEAERKAEFRVIPKALEACQVCRHSQKATGDRTGQVGSLQSSVCRGPSLTSKHTPLGPYRRPTPRALRGS